MALLRNGLSSAIHNVVGNFLFDNLGSKGDGKARSKYPQNPNSQRDFPAPDRKKSRPGTPTPDKHDKTVPVCNGCGRWISDKHSQETCKYIVKRLPGYNRNRETIGWERSDAHRAVMDKVHLTKPDHKGPFYLAPPKHRVQRTLVPKVRFVVIPYLILTLTLFHLSRESLWQSQGQRKRWKRRRRKI